MKSIAALLCLFSFTAYGQFFTVFDGYTLEPLSNFTVNSSNAVVTTVMHGRGSFTLTGATNKDLVVVSAAGFVSDTLAITRKTENEMIILQPEKATLAFRWMEFHTSPSKEALQGAEKVVETPAEFPGGKQALFKFLTTNLRYPEDEISYDISGKVYVSFIVETDGSISNIHITKGLTKGIDNEAMRIVGLMPNWTPAMNAGVVTRSLFTLPFTFKVQ